MALGTLLGMAWLMRRFQIPDGVSGAVCLLFALSPGFPVYRYWLFYTLPVAFLLVASAVALTVYLEKNSRAALVTFSGLVLAIMMMRSVFHPLWLVVVAAALAPVVEERKRFLIACAVVLMMMNLLFLKNYALVGSYSGSTWLGLSLTKRWPLSQRQVAELKSQEKLPEFWQRRPFQEPDYYQRFGFFQNGKSGHPTLAAPYKSNGEPNFNHRDYVAISDELLEADTGLIRNYPWRYARRVVTSIMLFLQPGPNSVHFLVDYDFEECMTIATRGRNTCSRRQRRATHPDVGAAREPLDSAVSGTARRRPSRSAARPVRLHARLHRLGRRGDQSHRDRRERSHAVGSRAVPRDPVRVRREPCSTFLAAAETGVARLCAQVPDGPVREFPRRMIDE